MNETTLDMLPKDTSARIVAIELPPGDAQRLMEMGLVRGTVVSVTRRAPFGGPLELNVRNTSMSLRKDTASRIRVQRVEAA
jgi:ferrous iron transport protein A